MDADALAATDPTRNSELEVHAQLALLPAPDPAPRLFVEQPVQDVLRLARPVVTRYATAEVL